MKNHPVPAGCRIYSDAGDNVYASRGVPGIYAPEGGARVLDLLEDKVPADNVAEMPLKLSPNQTVLLKLEIR